ncbi:copper resistance protein CopC [Micromonospora sp. NPDC005171]|uniref:copper resistance CopC family protein n=1 Tax=Micromonospora sp. NPDC005171 TaxID=3156866 RepID=UPI0033BC5820
MVRRGGALLLFVLLLSSVASPAAADGGLVTSDPAAGAAVPAAPAAVALTFSDAPDLTLSHIAVLDDAGNPIQSGDARQGPERTVTVPITVARPGNLTVAFHMALADGGEATGSLRFSVGTGVAPPAPSQVVRQATADALAAHQHSIDPMSAFLLFVDGLAVVVVLALLYLRRPYQAASDTPDTRP